MTRMTGLEPKIYPLTGGGWLLKCSTPGGEFTIEYDSKLDVTVMWKPEDGSEAVTGTVYAGEV